MSYRLVVLGDLPLAFWPLDETAGTTALDLTGMGHVATHDVIGTRDVPGLAKGVKAMSFTGLQRMSASVPGILQAGTESQSFAFECWAKFDAPPTATRVLMGRSSTNGIVVTPHGIDFRIASTDGTFYRAYYTVTDWAEPLHIVANYVGRNLGIIVNAQEGTNSDFFGDFVSTTATLWVGGVSTDVPQAVTLSAPAVYRNPIDIRTSTSHYDYGRAALPPLDISQITGGVYYSLDDSSADIMYRYDEAEGLVGEGVHTSDLQYIGQYQNVAGSRIDWEGSAAVTVEVSFNQGATWTACTNHAEVPGIGPGAYLANKFMTIRKTIPANADYELRLESLSLVIYRSKSVTSNLAGSGLTVYGSPTLAQFANGPMSSETNMGIDFTKTSYATVPPLQEGANSISFWYRRNANRTAAGTEWEYIVDTRNSGGAGTWFAIDGANNISVGTGTFYVNSVQKTPVIADFPIGRWVFVSITLPVTSVTPIFLNRRFTATEPGVNSFSHLTLYQEAKTARDVSVLYGMYRGLVNHTLLEPTAFTVREVPTGTRAYSFAWSSVQNGIS